ncbi:MAG: DEAD/DEAH box helicase family protein [Planctomycetota bacterium]|nr:DEAD/DEAH box helicase family protein [Planctomycetota bacterium]
MIRLDFDRGTLLVSPDGGLPRELKLPGAAYDPRVRRWRAPARCYRDILTSLRRANLQVEDRATAYEKLDLASRVERRPFPHQREAVDAWWRSGRRGIVVLPTGAGKTFAAQMIMERLQRSALVVTPTIDLMQQWYAVLSTGFDVDVGLIGGGYYEVRPLTVTTFDSAYLHMERLGNRFGLIVFDECHHLPGPSYQMAADCALAPYRLGLTATPEREDGQEHVLDRLIGPIVYRREIKSLAGSYLSPYETVRIRVRLSDEESRLYEEARGVYLRFLRENDIQMGTPGGWAYFLRMTSRTQSGREALLAYREQRSIAQASAAKLRLLDRLLTTHRSDRVLIFTNDNETVYRISRRCLIPAITHQTHVKERHELLQKFNEGSYPFLVTSKVLNEGIDVPEANVAVVLSGSGSVREHVQRLGRILRRRAGKRAILYEVVAENTAEEYTSSRRRQHHAYR